MSLSSDYRNIQMQMANIDFNDDRYDLSSVSHPKQRQIKEKFHGSDYQKNYEDEDNTVSIKKKSLSYESIAKIAGILAIMAFILFSPVGYKFSCPMLSKWGVKEPRTSYITILTHSVVFGCASFIMLMAFVKFYI